MSESSDGHSAEYQAIEQTVLGGLAATMQEAMRLRQAGKDDEAALRFRETVMKEPRLAEPRLELAHIALHKKEWEEAEGQAREAVELLKRGGQWTLEIDPDVLLAFALNLLGEVLVQSIGDVDLLEQDPEAFKAIWNDAAACFADAYELDPNNEEIAANRGRVLPVGA